MPFPAADRAMVSSRSSVGRRKDEREEGNSFIKQILPYCYLLLTGKKQLIHDDPTRPIAGSEISR